MDAALAVFLLALFAGSFVSGLAGFAMGVIVTAVWLHIMEPMQCAALVVSFSIVTQGYGAWKLRHALSGQRIWPFVAGGVVGVPVGTWLLAQANPHAMRVGIALLVILYSVYGLARPTVQVTGGGKPADAAIGLGNGIVAGMTGLAGLVITTWCSLRGWKKDDQRTVFQPVMLLTSGAAAASLASAGAYTGELARLFLIGIPFSFAGTWLGLRLYGKVNEAGFRRIVLVMLLLCGLTLVAPIGARG